jgi:predicted  nucleic acid-binding Zn-ribbon protein
MEKAMGILKDTGETIVKFGEIFINKTEEFAKIAKLNVDIKRLQIDQGIAEKDLGRHVIEKIDKGSTSIDASDPNVKELHAKVNAYKKKINEKKAEIEKVKAEAKMKSDSISGNKPEGGSQ